MLEEAVEVANQAGQPAQNFMVADAKGGIAWTILGKLPRRIGFDGRRPTSWADGKCRWDGWLCLARETEQVTARYGACLDQAEQAGAVWLDCVIRAGAGAQTPLHCLGDGALWIAAQSEKRFGEQASYLCDFYHVSEYLAAAAVPLAGSQSKHWLGWAQRRLKENRLTEVLSELAPKVELPGVKDEEAPVRACFRYLDKRRHQLAYQRAIEAGLPIGSGEVESGHRQTIKILNDRRVRITNHRFAFAKSNTFEMLNGDVPG